VEEWKWEATFYGHYTSIFNHCDVIGQQSNRIWWRKTQNNGYYAVQDHSRSFKVIQVGINRKPVCDFQLVINTNWHPISYRFGVIAAHRSNFGHFTFLSPFHWGLRGNLRCSSQAYWKARCGHPISVNCTFFASCYRWGATSE